MQVVFHRVLLVAQAVKLARRPGSTSNWLQHYSMLLKAPCGELIMTRPGQQELRDMLKELEGAAPPIRVEPAAQCAELHVESMATLWKVGDQGVMEEAVDHQRPVAKRIMLPVQGCKYLVHVSL